MEEEQKSNYTCKFCHKIFPCGRSLGGHMRSHLITIKRSDHEPTLCKKKRSDRLRRNTNNTNPSCLNSSPFDQQEQEEVALSLILLSMESSNLERELTPPRKRLESNENLEIEANSPEASIKENRSINPFGSDDYHKKRKRITKKKCINSRNYFPLEYKFSCMICRKGFHSYQALGGHRASHKKFKGCCDPTNDESQEIDGCKKSEDYERPTCPESFPSSHEGIRGFLDLNLPAPVEEECNEFKPWWIGTSHNYLLSS